MHIHIYIYVHTHIYECTYTFVNFLKCIIIHLRDACAFIHTYIYIHIYMYQHVYIHTYACTLMHIDICTYPYTHVFYVCLWEFPVGPAAGTHTGISKLKNNH